jgi:Tol biopolymer transport system component
MPLAPGARVGPYEVIDFLGEGGMGSVWRAQHTALKRDDALKVLPEAFAADPERLARFEREAQVLASLNHPNIAQVHGVEDAAGVKALVMELVEGPTLADRLQSGAITLDEALPIAAQIAEALAAAHDKGIVHRDLKPANIKVRSDGAVKVLDFGLAKAIEGSGGSGGSGRSGAESVLNSPTITSPAQMTGAGIILGTAAYMSPEQARGRAVDKRADIWAFGCVLYEMLTGRRAFEGEDVSDTLALVLRGEPDWSLIPGGTPPAVTTIMRRCLERDVRRRIGDVSTLRFVLVDHAQLSGATSIAPPVDFAPRIEHAVAQARQRVMMWRVLPLAIALLIAIAAIGYGASQLLTSPPPAPVMRFIVALDERQLASLVRPIMAIAPDGSQLAYLAGGQAYLRPISDFQMRAIPATDLGQSIALPTFSPDGQWIAFHSSTDRLVKKINVRGGPAVRVCQLGPIVPVGMSWSHSGILVGLGVNGIARCNPSGGQPEQLVKMQAGEFAGTPSLLPDGDGLLFAMVKSSENVADWDKADIVVQSMRTGSRRTVLSGGVDPRFVATGHLMYSVGGVVFAMPMDARTYERRGDPTPVIEGVRRSTGIMHLSVSQAGTVAYVPGPVGDVTTRGLGIADRAGTVTPLVLPLGPYTHVRASRDGTTLAIGSEDANQAIIWTYPLSGTAAMQRLAMEGKNRFPVWSPDGKSVAFQSDRGGESGIYRQRVDGTAAAERLTSAGAGETHIPESWSPDGRHIAYAVQKPGEHALWIVTVDTKRAEPFANVTSRDPLASVFSPDGKWIAFAIAPTTDLQSSERGVFVRSFPSGDRVYQAPRQLVDFHPVWTSDGQELVYVASTSTGQMAASKVTVTGGMTFNTASRFPTTVTGERLSTQLRAFDILPDGRFVGPITDEQSRRTVNEIRVVVNWLEDVKARAPIK